MENLSNPTEAMLCSLILAALPRLQHVHVFAQPLPYTGLKPLKEDSMEIARLTRGIGLSSPKTLTISSGPKTFLLARSTDATTLALGNTVPGSIYSLPHIILQRVTRIKVRLTCRSATDERKIAIFLTRFPSALLSLELDSPEFLRQPSFTLRIDTIVFRSARAAVIDWVCNIFPRRNSIHGPQYATPAGLKRIEMHWPDDDPGMPHLLPEIHRPAKLRGMVIVMFWKGEVYRAYG